VPRKCSIRSDAASDSFPLVNPISSEGPSAVYEASIDMLETENRQMAHEIRELKTALDKAKGRLSKEKIQRANKAQTSNRIRNLHKDPTQVR